MNDNVYCCVLHVSGVLRNSWETQGAPSCIQGHCKYMHLYVYVFAYEFVWFLVDCLTVILGSVSIEMVLFWTLAHLQTTVFLLKDTYYTKQIQSEGLDFTFPPSALYSFSLTSSRRARPKSVILMWLGVLTRTFRAARSL